MITLTQWQIRHHVSAQAMYELQQMLGVADTTPPAGDHPPHSEAAVQSDVRAQASKIGGRLFRNSVGAAKMEDGSFIRFGLANDSEAMNKVVKSSDLIGLFPYLVKPADVGHTLGQFWAPEIKAEGWRYTGTPREKAQLAFINLVVALGGRGEFISRKGFIP